MLVTIFINTKEYDVTAQLINDQLTIQGRLNIPELDQIANTTLQDAIEMQVNDLHKVIGSIELEHIIINWAATLSEIERYKIHNGRIL
jgi:hypothetical protein